MDTCIFISRKIVNSEVWSKPPLYLKVWLYLLIRAQHSDYKDLKRGQVYTSIPEIQDACTYYLGFRKVRPTKDQIYNVLKWLRDPTGKISREGYGDAYGSDTEATMIATMKATHGMVVTICNYSFYQDINNYGSNGESNYGKATGATMPQRQASNINKNEKNGNNVKNVTKIYSDLPEILIHPFEEYLAIRKANGWKTSDYAISLLLKKLNTLSGGDTGKAEAIINQSIERCWRSFFPITTAKDNKTRLDELIESGVFND
jgi:hypothetical protein